MKILQRTGTILITLVFLLGSTGISFYTHTCYSSKIHKTIVYPGIFKSTVSCCCSSTPNSDGSSEIDMASCCKSATATIKLASGYIPSVNTITLAPETIRIAPDSPPRVAFLNFTLRHAPGEDYSISCTRLKYHLIHSWRKMPAVPLQA
jgi:hypothetical protein